MRTLHRTVCRGALLALGAALSAAQSHAQGAGRVITQADYDIWRSIQGTTLSRDGRWLAYSLVPAVGDGDLVVRSTKGSTEWRVPRGYVGRPQLQPNADSGFTAPPPQFSYDGRVVAALTYASRAEFERARRGRRAADQPATSLAIVSLADGKVTTVPRVRSFAMPREAGGWIAYLLAGGDSAGGRGADSARTPGVAAATPGGTPRPISGDSTARRGGRRQETGATLVVRELASGNETRIEDVTTYAFADSGRWLAYTTASRAESHNGAFVRALGASGIGAEVALLSGKGSYRALTFDRAQKQVAFVSDHADSAAARPRMSLYQARLAATPTTRALVTPAGLAADRLLSDRGVSFTRDGSAVVFSVTPPRLDSIPADSLADKAVFDLWNYKDTRLQPQQRLEAARDRGRSYTAVYQLGTGKWLQLTNDSIPQVSLSEDGREALAVTNVPYALEALWGEGANDVYLLDTRTGARKPVARNVRFRAELSPAGRYVVWFADHGWHAYDAQSGKTTDLTAKLTGVRFDQETWDTPSDPQPWGVAAWTADDRSVLVYSHYDVWELDPSGARPAKVVTDSVGTKTHVQFRLVSTGGARGRFRGGDATVVDPSQPLLLSAFDDRSKESGFYRERLDAATPPERIVMAAYKFGAPIKAADADVYAVTRQSFTEFPDVWVGERLDRLTKVTDANPQQKQYAWGSAELFEWANGDGVPLQGVVYKPANFDPSKKYPMLVTYYEQMSDNLYAYDAPAGRNRINPTVYASNGYVVFTPDIAYTTGYPGQSALKSVVPGVQAIVARGFVDPKRVGIGGQSWGGYQSAYIVTQTPMFAAAFLGAPVANMTSAYGGIRWESGNSRVQQYERGQSRIGATLWDAPMRYIENSPLFYVPRITTPVLIMSNDADGAVPWYQGIELFIALKRFGKEAYLVEYNGEGHNPRKRANQLDIDRRMQQFFAAKLKGEPAPEWMEKGIPFVNKGRDQLAPVNAQSTATSAGQATLPR
ncbi:S9 family peptidase [Gemmatirosa kalamazoonensis]|nr:prolyl oligopeptidase family serine peptidase [Gemmatirosa kalamazoonensis]